MRNDSNVQKLDLKETQIAIKTLKDYFQRNLANILNLERISAPLIVRPETGLNDNLSGKEKAVNFNIRNYDINVEIVQSLAKWKRNALKLYGFNFYEGLYADMNALRPDEELDRLHSVYVDQWDWEKIIKKEDRNEQFLMITVKEIYEVFKSTERYINQIYPYVLEEKLVDDLFFITSQELEDLYPNLSSNEREDKIAKDKKAVFIRNIGNNLKSGKPHDLRSPDYDDWQLNGDLIFWDEKINRSIELTSMGIRVDEDSLVEQLEKSNNLDRINLPYHKDIINKRLPYTIGGGIGQSRLCMFFLEKQHIGEVQSSVWDEKTMEFFKDNNLLLL